MNYFSIVQKGNLLMIYCMKKEGMLLKMSSFKAMLSCTEVIC